MSPPPEYTHVDGKIEMYISFSADVFIVLILARMDTLVWDLLLQAFFC